MCGIAGFFQCGFLDAKDLKQMTRVISHRGPDDEGFYFDSSSSTGLGHRRLSILDLSSLGHQPMTYEKSGLWIIFNGEIYNFIELRDELSKKGYSFYSQSDTEVILAAYLEWGRQAFSRFNGMWALALFDEKNRELLLCRDRYGIKPLYYWTNNNNQLVFGSEYKVFLSVAGRLGIGWDFRGIKTSILNSFQLESSGFTLLQNVRNLPPGHYLVANERSVGIHRWWSTLDHLVEVPSTVSEQALQLKDLLEDSCRLRLRSDVPIGTSLSGGLDSSSIALLTASLLKTKAQGKRAQESVRKAFIHSFKGTSLDETAYADTAADAAGAEKIHITADLDKLMSDFDRILYHFESIYPGMPDSAWRVYEAQRANGVIVSLDGHGVDEMLGGYSWYPTAVMEGLSIFAPKLWEMMKVERDMFGNQVPRFFTAKTILHSRLYVKAVASFIKKLTGADFLLARSFFTSEAAGVPSYPAVSTDLPTEMDALTRVLYQDFHHGILPRILRNFDLMSMSHGVEVRMPFMDYRIVNFVFSLPGTSKIGEGYTKLVLRKAMKGLLPEEIRLRKTKVGFNSPVVDWFQGEMKPWIADVLDRDSPLDEIISKSRLKEFFLKKISVGRADWNQTLFFWTHVNAIRLTQIIKDKGMRL